MTKTKYEEKPRGWANLQQQLKEVREESFKQGIWKGRQEALKEVEKMIDEFPFERYEDNDSGFDYEKCINELKQKLKELGD